METGRISEASDQRHNCSYLIISRKLLYPNELPYANIFERGYRDKSLNNRHFLTSSNSDIISLPIVNIYKDILKRSRAAALSKSVDSVPGLIVSQQSPLNFVNSISQGCIDRFL